MLEKMLVLLDVPTMGTRLDLRAEGVEGALTVVGVTLRAIADGPGLRVAERRGRADPGAAGGRETGSGRELVRAYERCSTREDLTHGITRSRARSPRLERTYALRAEPEGSARLCPVCRERPLRGAQTVCSPKCRAARHRQRRDAARQQRDAEVRALLEAALQLLATTTEQENTR
jgi:hypothetical protein